MIPFFNIKVSAVAMDSTELFDDPKDESNEGKPCVPT